MMALDSACCSYVELQELFKLSWKHWQVGKSDSRRARLDAADEVGEGGVLDQARQLAPVRRGHQLHPPLRDAPRGQRLSLRPYLILQMGHIYQGPLTITNCIHSIKCSVRRKASEAVMGGQDRSAALTTMTVSGM